MFITARQLEELHRNGGGNGQVVVPYRARLSPLAQDWIRHKKVAIGYADVPTSAKEPLDKLGTAQALEPPLAVSQQRKLLWWCDGPCGPAKAALASAARDANVESTEIGVNPHRIVEAIRVLASSIKAGRVDTGVLLVSNGATAMVYANRCPSLRAVLGTCIESVEQAVKLVAANVLVLEHPHKSLPEAKNLLSRFLHGKRVLSDDVKHQLQELSTCA